MRLSKRIALLAFASIFIFSCKKDSGTNAVQVSLGDTYQGGKIAYILQSGDPGYTADAQHGLIVAGVDQSTSAVWGLVSQLDIGTATNLGSGSANTKLIVASFSSTVNYAAKICADLTLNGYDDWYLPSKDELDILYKNKSAVGDFANERYWSSSEGNTQTGWRQDMAMGNQATNTRSNLYYVRAVRSF